MPFVDTNVLIYAVCPGSHERAKAQIAREILRRDDLTFGIIGYFHIVAFQYLLILVVR